MLLCMAFGKAEETRMQIQLNGDPVQIEDGMTIQQLIIHLGLTGKRIAVERNLEIVPKSLFTQTVLAEQDQVEIVHAIGGG